MSNELYSVEQVSSLLDLHPRTVRNYLREGRLKGSRIGKQYRITREALEAFTGHPVAAAGPAWRTRRVEVSSVIQIDAISPDAASRVSNTLMAATKSGDGEGDHPLRVDSIYDAARGGMKIVVIGGLAASAGVLRMIAALTDAAG